MQKKQSYYSSFLLILFCLQFACHRQNSTSTNASINNAEVVLDTIKKLIFPQTIQVSRNITIDDYFEYLDSIVQQYDSVFSYPFSEHILVRNNPWVMDSLANTDYYRMMARDSFVYDQRKLIVLPKGSTLQLPDSLTACRLLNNFEATTLDVNIPEYKLRIYQDSVLLYTFTIRVGQNRKRFLVFGNRETDLRTKTGVGEIVKHVKNPDFYNPVTGKRFYLTKRDDGKTTVMPRIPWIETQINGVRNGQMIHPTTNPETLEKASSNGCIGIKEADAWVIYYYAPLGTKIKIRYDLNSHEEGNIVNTFNDIYSKDD